MRIYFDVHGTLIDNPKYDEAHAIALLELLFRRGVEVVVWSNDPGGVPEGWHCLAARHNTVIREKSLLPDVLRDAFMVVDDDPAVLRTVARCGVIAVPASKLPGLHRLLDPTALIF